MASEQLIPGPVPLYYQLKQIVQYEIKRGVYHSGDRLPSETDMIQRYGVSRITVRQALSELEREGVVVRRHGRGTYVADRNIEQDLVRLTDFVEDMEQAGLTPSSQVLRLKREVATAYIAEALQVSIGEEVMLIERLRLADERPIAYDSTWLPLRFGLLLSQEELAHETIYHILETRYNIPVEMGVFHITASTANVEQAHLLQVTPGAGLLLIRRVSYTTGNTPVYVQDRYYRTDRVSYRVTLRRHGDPQNGSNSLEELRPIFDETRFTQKGAV
ncbi:MAG: GntR family transcriptional regulator [Ktedonobacteraceae bacterium]